MAFAISAVNSHHQNMRLQVREISCATMTKRSGLYVLGQRAVETIYLQHILELTVCVTFSSFTCRLSATPYNDFLRMQQLLTVVHGLSVATYAAISLIDISTKRKLKKTRCKVSSCKQ